MAILGKEYSERGLNEPRMTQASPEAASSQGKMFVDVGDTTSQVAEKLEQAHVAGEETIAENTRDAKLAEISVRAKQDPDFSHQGLKKYHDEMDRVVEDSAKSITLENAKNIFINSSKSKIEIDKLKVATDFRDRFIDHSKANMEIFINNQKKQYVSSDNMTEKTNAILRRDSKLDQMASSGFITRQEAEIQKLKLQKTWDADHLTIDAEKKPDFVLQELAKPEGGFYRGVTEEEKTKALESAKRFQKKQKTLVEKQASTNMKITMDKFQTDFNLGKLDPIQVKEEMLKHENNPLSGIPAKFAKALLKGHESSLALDANTDGATYKDLVSKMLDTDISHDDLRSEIINANAEGKLSKGDMNELYQMNLIPTTNGQYTSIFKVYGEDVASKDIENSRKSLLGNAINFIEKSIPAIQYYNAIKDFMSHVGKNGTPSKDLHTVAYNHVKQARVRMKPEIASYPESGTQMIDDEGNVATVFPDGDIQESEDAGDKSSKDDSSDASY